MRIAALLIALTPSLALAAGSGSSEPPKPSETVTECQEGLVFDIATQTCMSPEDSTNSDQARLDDARSLGYLGRHGEALALLETVKSDESLSLTLKGYNTRKSGDVPGGMALYAAALAIDPDNLLARSYRGQAHVEAGDVALALAELSEIRMRGGAGTWPEQALADAINSGDTTGY